MAHFWDNYVCFDVLLSALPKFYFCAVWFDSKGMPSESIDIRVKVDGNQDIGYLVLVNKKMFEWDIEQILNEGEKKTCLGKGRDFLLLLTRSSPKRRL